MAGKEIVVNKDFFRNRESRKGVKSISVDEAEKIDVAKKIEKVAEVKKESNKTRIFSVEMMESDLPKFDAVLLKLSHRDGVLYRKKDLYIAMAKNFLDSVENNIGKVKIEKY